MFNIYNWFWLDSSGRVYSSSQQAVVGKDDKEFLAWKAGGNLPTPWPKNRDGKETDEALAAVLAANGLQMFPPSLDETKESLKLKIDAAAEKERLKYITDGVGQSMTYTEKFNQAIDYSKKYTAHANDPKNEPERKLPRQSLPQLNGRQWKIRPTLPLHSGRADFYQPWGLFSTEPHR